MVEASQAYLTILQHAPQHWPSFYNLGLVFQSLNRLHDACVAYQRVVAIKPDFAQAYNNMGIVLQGLKRDDEAVGAYERAIALDATLAQARYNMALIQQARGQITASTDSLRAAVKANPKDDKAWDGLYRALLGLRRQEDAIQTFLSWEKAIGQSPALTAAGLVMSRYLGDESKANAYVKLAVEWPFADILPSELAPILGILQYFDLDGNDLLKCYRRYDEASNRIFSAPVARLPRRAHGDKIRIGYVSGDFRRHVMGRIMLDVITAHDRDRFSVHLISLCEPQYHDATTVLFKSAVDNFFDISKLTDVDAAKVIAEADLDVLVDLAGHTMAARPGIYALRPAHKIVTHLGYHGCLGLSAVDYKFTDSIADDDASAAFQIEKPFYLEGCLFPLTHLESTAEEKAKYKRDETKRVQEFVFATFVNVLKMSPRCLAVWRKILDAIPQAVLAFSPVNPNDEPSIRRAVRAAGMDDARIRFIAAGATDGEQRARYQLVDAVLDTFPYTGGDTTLAALDCNVPVITLRNTNKGARNAERVGASIFTHLGIEDTICSSEAEYVACAVRVAKDRAWRESLGARIVDARQKKPMANVKSYTKTLESAFAKIAAEEPKRESSAMSATEFFSQFNLAIKAHEAARDEHSKARVADAYAKLEAEQPGYVPLLKLRAMLARSCGLSEQAITYLQQVLSISPADYDSAITLAAIYSDAQANDIALTVIDAALFATPAALQSRPAYANLLTTKARILLRLDRAEDALLAADLAITAAPADVQANLMRANTLAELGQRNLALQAYSRVLSIAPQHVEAAYNAALMSLESGDAITAETIFRRAINADASHELAHIKLAQALRVQGKTDAWISLAKRIAAEFPHSVRGKLVRAETLRYEQDLAGETREMLALAKSLCKEPDHFVVEEVAQPILGRAAALGLSENVVTALADRYLVALNEAYSRIGFDAVNSRKNAGKNASKQINIGLLVEDATSTNARDQLVTQFAKSFANKDSSITLYALAKSDEKFVDGDAAVPSVVSLAGLGPMRAARRIANDGLDVLIDLVGYRHALAPPIMFQKPARMQLVNGAFAAVFDCPAIDFEIFDEWTALPSWKGRGPSRPVIRLSALTGELIALPKQATKIDANATSPFVFAIGAATQDISLESIRVWKSILDQLPHAVIAVPASSDAELRAYHDVLRAGGIGSTRIAQLDMKHESRNRFAAMGDGVVLDTIRVSDAIVAAEALAADVPVIAMRGPIAPERMAFSVLARTGLDELVADSGRDYIAVAAKYALEAAFRADVRAKLYAHLSNAQDADGQNQTSPNYQALVFALKETAQHG
jgi:predicted O-linked N-acetylglucosamine transferase (SPINDLY family)